MSDSELRQFSQSVSLFFAAESTLEVGENGIGSGSSLLNLQVTRSELGANLTCKVSSSPALAEPLTIDIKLDVHGRHIQNSFKLPTHRYKTKNQVKKEK